MSRNRVVIVNEGHRGWLSSDRGDYDSEVHTIADVLTSFDAADEQQKDKLQFEVVSSSADVRTDHTLKAVVFVSHSMLARAQEIQDQHREVNVVVLTGLIPKGDVVVIQKDWVDSRLLLQVIRRRLLGR